MKEEENSIDDTKTKKMLTANDDWVDLENRRRPQGFEIMEPLDDINDIECELIDEEGLYYANYVGNKKISKKFKTNEFMKKIERDQD